MKLFKDSTLGDQFCAVDVAQLRARELAVAICPPGFEPELVEEADPEECINFTCDQCVDGFGDMQGLLLHMNKNTDCKSSHTLPPHVINVLCAWKCLHLESLQAGISRTQSREEGATSLETTI